jgi:hypothetical protein
MVKAFCTYTITSQSLKYLMLDLTSQNKRISLKYIQRKRSTSFRQRLKTHFLLRKIFFRIEFSPFSSWSSFPLFKISCVLNVDKPTWILSSVWQNACKYNQNFQYWIIFTFNFLTFLCKINIRECKCHRLASTNSFSDSVQFYWWIIKNKKHLQ